jgi:hypothetical protein
MTNPSPVEAASTRAIAFDLTAMGLSAACAAHCLAIPIAAATLPLFAAIEEAEWIHWAFVALAAPVSWMALARPGVSWLLRFGAVLGLAGLLVGALAWPSEAWETPLTVAGGAVLASLHLLNATRRHRHAPAK